MNKSFEWKYSKIARVRTYRSPGQAKPNKFVLYLVKIGGGRSAENFRYRYAILAWWKTVTISTSIFKYRFENINLHYMRLMSSY